MTKDKMLELLGLLDPASVRALTLAGITDEQLEFALFHVAYHIEMQRDKDKVAACADCGNTLNDGSDICDQCGGEFK